VPVARLCDDLIPREKHEHTALPSSAKPKLAHDPVRKFAMLEFIFGLNQHTSGFDDALDALLQSVPKSRGKDAELALVLVI
jgi:hypothetical protein